MTLPLDQQVLRGAGAGQRVGHPGGVHRRDCAGNAIRAAGASTRPLLTSP
jgi:hypothetical protein